MSDVRSGSAGRGEGAAARGPGGGTDSVHQVVFRWDGNHGRQGTGMNAVARSCTAERAEEVGRELGPLLWVSGAAASRPSTVRVVSRDGGVMLVYRWPTTDRGGRPSTVSHVLVGDPRTLKTRQCLALAYGGWGRQEVAETVTGPQRTVDCAQLDRLALRRLPEMLERLPSVRDTLAVVTAEWLRDPAQRVSLLTEPGDRRSGHPDQDEAPLVYLGLFLIFGTWLRQEWTFATYDTVDTHPLRLMCVPRWEEGTGGSGPLARVTGRPVSDPRFEHWAADRLVDHLLAHREARAGVPQLVDEFADGATWDRTRRRERLREILDPDRHGTGTGRHAPARHVPDRNGPGRDGTPLTDTDRAGAAWDAPDRHGTDLTGTGRGGFGRPGPDDTGWTGTGTPGRTGTEGPGRSGADRHGGDRAGTTRFGTGRHEPDRTGAGRNGAERHNPDRTGTGRTGTEQTRTDRNGTDQAGTAWTGTNQSDPNRHGTDQTGQDRTGQDRTGVDRTGTAWTGTDLDDPDRHDPNRHGTDQTGGRHPVPIAGRPAPSASRPDVAAPGQGPATPASPVVPEPSPSPEPSPGPSRGPAPEPDLGRDPATLTPDPYSGPPYSGPPYSGPPYSGPHAAPPPSEYAPSSPEAPARASRPGPGTAPQHDHERELHALRQDLRDTQRGDSMRREVVRTQLRALPDESLVRELRSDDLPPDSVDLLLDELGDPRRVETRQEATRHALCEHVLRRNLYFSPPGQPGGPVSRTAMADRSADLFTWAVAPLARDPRYLTDLRELLHRMLRDTSVPAGNWLHKAVVAPPDGQAPDLPPELWQQLVRDALQRGTSLSAALPASAAAGPTPTPHAPSAPAPERPDLTARLSEQLNKPGCLMGIVVGVIVVLIALGVLLVT
ncbi:hypothetical protein [Streptomyces sp. AC627_RSS907]|uniref:hypothetical protein n=1 Tax=Streptomyces sp. AC627_RSS907 TaxID=2823684 RepID=UPI001C22488E|nr:hypothetical protein [Streptomyces sp. AC627_RSS907]